MGKNRGVWQQTAGIIETIRKSTALYPLLVTNVILVVLCAVLVPFISLILQIILIALLVISIFSTIGVSIFFAITDPDRLAPQSQVIQKIALQMLGDESHNLGATAADIVAIVNPNNAMRVSDAIELETDKPLPLPQPSLPENE